MKPEINKLLRKHYGTAKKGLADELIELFAGKDEAVIYPYDSDEFRYAWKLWKDYKRLDHNFKYKSIGSQQAALNTLANMSQDEEEALSIVYYTMGQGWKGFVKPKNERINTISSQDVSSLF